MKKRIRVYVAGVDDGDSVISVLQNIGRGEKACAELFKMGFAPFCPWHDKSYIIDNPDVDFTTEDFYEYSIAWLVVSEVVLVLPNSSLSWSTTREVEIAKGLGIPVCYSIDELVKFCAYFKQTIKEG